MPSYNTLVIMAHSAQIEISIEGKNLDLLIPYLLAAQVEWIRESENPMMNDAGEGVFISAIKLEGKAFE